MKKISIVIVNYNVEYFLDQCLQSLFKSIENIDAEVFVVDNNSVDNSVNMVKDKYKQVILIENTENFGFSKANNQAISQSSGEYVLLLNPDTLLQIDTISKILDFMYTHSDAGGLGVQMIDGKGNFLPESKRSLPTPMVAFYKIFGLSKFFPKNKKFARYHLSYLDKNKTHEVDVLSGAFLLIRKSILDEIGYLDETFFMYGEDIDLSYRITKAGYKNYYFADTKIIHYKGESTKKGSLNYVITFYNAMLIFAKKHYSSSKLNSFIFFIKIAIFFRASLAIISRFSKKLFMPILDFVIILSGFYLITKHWENVILPPGGDYPQTLIFVALPIYVLIWQFSAYINSAYEKKVKLEGILKGIITGTIIILLIYSLLDVSMRFSRALIFIGSLWALIGMLISRILTNRLIIKKYSSLNKRMLIIGSLNEAERVKNIILQNTEQIPSFLKFLCHNDTKNSNNEYIGTINQLDEVVRIYNIDEIVFCGKDISSAAIIEKMSLLQKYNIEMKIAPSDSVFIIGSNSINASGDVFTMKMSNIDQHSNKLKKRIFDIVLSLIFLTLYPILLWFFKKPILFLKNIFYVLFAKKTWVSFSLDDTTIKLPKIKSGVLNPTHLIENNSLLDSKTKEKLNLNYARNYKVETDLRILFSGFSKLDNF